MEPKINLEEKETQWSEIQTSLKQRLVLPTNEDHTLLRLPSTPIFPETTTFSGSDLTESSNPDISPVASYCILNSTLNALINESHVKTIINEPYIPSYLSFRETPTLLPLILSYDEPAYLLTDGNGRLHPRQFGFACHMAVLLEERGFKEVKVIGVGKNLHIFEGLRLLNGEEVNVRYLRRSE